MRTGNVTSITARRGQQLAIEMVAELEDSVELQEACMFPPEDTQRNIVLERLDQVRALGRDAGVAFTAILSDYIANGAAGCTVDPAAYESALLIG